MLKDYYAATVYRAAQFAVGIAAADAEQLCLALNSGRDPSKDYFALFNGSVIYIAGPGKTPLTVSRGNWIVGLPDGSMDVHADADFQASFVAK
jgi:hypothetical protein